MRFSKEMITKAKTAASAEELLKLAADEGVTLTAEEAEKYFSFLSGEGELNDEAMEAVAGGKGWGAEAKFHNGQTVQFWYPPKSTWLSGDIITMYPHDTCWTYKVRTNVGKVYDEVPLEDAEYKTFVL